MNHSLMLAIILIAIYSVSTGANGQNSVYRCGNSYSQKPCTDAVVVDVQDARTREQKVQADATIRRDTATANAIEKARLAEEARQHAAQTKLAAAQNKGSTPKPKNSANLSDTATTKATKGGSKKNASKQPKHAPEHFIANVPSDGTKPSTRTDKGK